MPAQLACRPNSDYLTLESDRTILQPRLDCPLVVTARSFSDWPTAKPFSRPSTQVMPCHVKPLTVWPVTDREPHSLSIYKTKSGFLFVGVNDDAILLP